MSWYPQVFRRIQTDYLQFVATLNTSHKHLIPLFQRALKNTETSQIVDLCSGGTGPWVRLREHLINAGLNVRIKLTDKYPNPDAAKKWSDVSNQGIEYLSQSVDAMNVPLELKGMRTLFEGFHHFKPEQAKKILKDAIDKGEAIGIFEASLKPPFGLLILLMSPLLTLASYCFMTPFIKPRTVARFLWTYLIPIVPLATCWDGAVSLLRVYSEEELKVLTQAFSEQDYHWEIGTSSTGTPVFAITYLVGYPRV